MWFNSKATLTRAEGNTVFNIPRAAINLNDGLGGGNNITLQSIFNTCRCVMVAGWLFPRVSPTFTPILFFFFQPKRRSWSNQQRAWMYGDLTLPLRGRVGGCHTALPPSVGSHAFSHGDPLDWWRCNV